MLLRRPEFLVLLLSVSALFLSIKLIDRLRAGHVKSSEFSRDKLRRLEGNRLFYLKASKCPRDTIQKIVMRFGFLRGLDFSLPGWTLVGHSHIFIQDKFDYNQLRNVIHPETVWITTLFNPDESYSSGTSTSDKYFRLFTGGNLTLNPIARRLGYAFPTFDTNYMKKFLSHLTDAFDLVLISEHMEASLVLLCRLMNWPLENVVFLPDEPTNEAKLIPTGNERQEWPTTNEVDFKIYSHFLAKFRQLVLNYGQARMIRDVSTLMSLNSRFAQTCSAISKCEGALKSDQDLKCKLSETDDSVFTELIRREQIRRSGAIKSLRKLMGSE